MKKLCAVVFGVCVMLGAFAADEVPAYWQCGSNWGLFDEPNNWKIGDPETGSAGVPGAGNYIWITPTSGQTTPMKFDLGGGTCVVGGMSTLNATAYDVANGRAMTLSVTNGTMTISGHVCGKINFEVWNGATFRLSTDVKRQWDSSTPQTVSVHSGARFEDFGTLEFKLWQATVEEGGTYVHTPTAFGIYYKNSSVANGLTNRGRFEAPNGITVTYTTSGGSAAEGRTTYRNEGDGVFLLGGEVKSTTQPTQAYYYEFVGGTLEASNDVAFVGFRDKDRLFFDNAVEVKVDDDSTLTLAGFQYGENAALTKTGAGRLTLGENAIPSLAVNGGMVEVVLESALPGTVSFADGTTLRLVTTGTELAPTSYEGMAFEVDESVCTVGATLIISSDADFLAYAKGGLAAAVAPFGFGVRIDGDSIKVTQESDYMFDATKSDDLSDPTAWKGGEVPVGQDVVIAGAGTVRYNASAPAFASITVQDGATVSVEGGTAENPVEVPTMTLNYDARLLIAEDATARMTNEFTCVGDDQKLPVFEIATNATAIVQSPEHPVVHSPHAKSSYAALDYGFRLKNAHLKWYGTIKMAEGDLGDVEIDKTKYRYARLTLGTADDGETSYIAIDCQGGKYLAAAEGNQSGHCLSALVIATPVKGGVVVPIGTLRFRDYVREEQRPTVAPNPGNRQPGIFIGVCSEWYTGNPAEVVYDVVFEGTTDLSVLGNCSIAGGAHVYLKGPAQWRYVRTASNDESQSRCIKLYDEATLTVEDGAYLDICSSDDTYRGLQATGTEDGQRVFTAKDSKLSLLNWSGSGKNTAYIDDVLLEIGYLRSAKTFGLIDGVFNGLKSVEIRNLFTIAAADVDRANGNKQSVKDVENWNRWVRIGPPLTGTGSIAVSNELSGAHAVYSMTVVVTNGENTATGEAKVLPTDTGAPAYLAFADGANWAGTVVADGNVSLTNLTDGASAASVAFGSLRLDSDFPIRVWKTGGAIVANDRIDISTAITGNGRIVLVGVDERIVAGDRIELGIIPTNATLPVLKGGTLGTEAIPDDPDHVRLIAIYGKGMILLLR